MSNRITQNGKTFTSNSWCSAVINNKHYEGWTAWWLTSGLFFVGCALSALALVGFGYWLAS